MQYFDTPSVVPLNNQPYQGPDALIADLVGQVYESVPLLERRFLLQQLLRPLGVLSLMGIANGIFAKLRFRGGLQDCFIHAEDALHVHTEDVVVLVSHVQDICVEAVDSLAQFLTTSPAVAGSAAAALLVALLIERARARSARRAGGADPTALLS